ncbi:MAG: DivIVA domain-containing protein [Calditrichaeota bacterium]|nr:MAG: DivIVA domain-containing protein [Calditrichota bacterium]
MDLSPNDIRNYEFPNQMRGYDKEEVDSFLNQIATAMENLKQEHLRLSMENDSIKSQLDNVKQYEEAIKAAAIDSRKNADLLVSKAKDDTMKMLKEAKEKAEHIVAEQQHKLTEYADQLKKLENTKNSFVEEIREIIHGHLNMVKKIDETEFSYDPAHAPKINIPVPPIAPAPSSTPEKSEDAEDISLNDSSKDIDVVESEELSRAEMTSIASAPKQEQIITEEANAPDKIVEAQEAPVDPELAAALKKYDHTDNQGNIDPETMIGDQKIPKQGEVVVTNKRAEDIPDGFITPKENGSEGMSSTTHGDNEEDDNSEETGKVTLSHDAQEHATEHNTIDIDTPVVDDKKNLSPDNILEELDNVVAKFEETVEKAEKGS